jgi:hypothetical protein
MRAAWGMAGGIMAAGLVFAPGGLASAEPVPQGNAYATIGQLESDGYYVNIDRVGSAPLDQCFVTSVRNPQDITRTFFVDRGIGKNGRRDRELVTVVVRRTITVSLNCDTRT